MLNCGMSLQIFATSKDGTQVPMFVVAKKGTQLNGKNPTLLYGYGGHPPTPLPSFMPFLPHSHYFLRLTLGSKQPFPCCHHSTCLLSGE